MTAVDSVQLHSSVSSRLELDGSILVPPELESNGVLAAQVAAPVGGHTERLIWPAPGMRRPRSCLYPSPCE
jgi:hypothetical protein